MAEQRRQDEPTAGPDRRLGWAYRLKRGADISRVFDRGLREGDSLITLLLLPGQDASKPSRLAVAVSKTHGNAPRRNRIKRICREAFRLVRSDLPAGWDYVIIPRKGAELTVAGVQGSLPKLAAKAAGEQAKRSDP